MADIGKLQQVEIVTEVKKAYLDYAMSVIVTRALPDVRDGLKPVHRRILFGMQQMGVFHNSKFTKSAKIVGEVMGKYHPHGDIPIYDSLVRMAQDFSMRYPLVDGQGNFGSMDGDPPAHMRYCVIADTLITTDKGLIQIKEISPNQSEDISISVLSRERKVNKASKWFDSGKHQTIKIETNQGFTLQGTYNHPVLIWSKDAVTGKPCFTWKLLSEVKEGDFAVIDRTDNLLWPKDEHSLVAYKPKNLNPRIEIKKLPKTLNKPLAFILGSLIAEGTLKENELEFCNSDSKWIREFKKNWNKVFPDCRLHHFKRLPNSYGKKPYETLEVHSRYVLAFLENIGLKPEKSAQRTIPKLIFQSPKEIVSEFLKTYFEGDGTITTSKNLIELSCGSVSMELTKQIQLILLRYGILATRRFDKYRNLHKLYLRGFKNYLLFEKEIGFCSERKQKKLNSVTKEANRRDQSLFDFVPFLKDYVYKSLDASLNYDNFRGFVYKHNFDRYSTMQINYQRTASGVIQTLQPEIQNLFKNLLFYNYVFDRIVKIQKAGVSQVYSIKVDSTCHSFVANGFINHNTEARMAAITAEMLFDIDKETVDFIPNFDATEKEPVFLPAKLPNLLLMGSEGIAVGMATKIPPHNLGEVIDAVVHLIGKTKAGKAKNELGSEVSVEELLEFIKGPDFPTAGSIYDIAEIKNVYTTGRGRIIIRGKADIEDIGQGKSAIIITELPYQVNKALLVARIADLAKEKKIDGITDLRDESDRHGIRVVIELKRDAVPKKVLNNLYKHTALQTIFPANIVALVDGTPQTLNLKSILLEYLKHRYSVVTRRSEFELRQAQARLHILEGLKIAVDNIDAVIQTIRRSKDQEDAKQNLMTKFKLSELQATAILDMQLRRLAALERQKIEDEYKMVKETIEYLVDLLAHPAKILTVIKDELAKLKERYADERRTKVYKSKVGEFSDEDLIQNEPTVITLTTTGYIKRQSMNSFRTQQRGGKGIKGMTTKEEDTILHIRSAQTHDAIIFFTNKGKAYALRAFEIAESQRTSKGTAIINLLNIEQGEKVESFVVRGKDEKAGYVFLTTRNGTVKKSSFKEFENIRRSGMIAVKLDKKDELVWSNVSSGDDDIIIVSRNGKAIRFSEKSVRPMGRNTMGVRGIRITGDDEVIQMDVIAKNDKPDLLAIMENGLGKKTNMVQFKRQGRGGQGVKVANVTSKTGKVVFAQIIPPNCKEVIITSKRGQIVKLEVAHIPKLSRATQGVILMRFSNASDKVASATTIEE